MAIVDIRMPPTFTDEGLRAAITLRREYPGTGVLMFSQYVETRYAARLLAGGAAGVGYLLKDRVADVAEFSSTRWPGSRPAAPHWTRRWSARWSAPARGRPASAA